MAIDDETTKEVLSLLEGLDLFAPTWHDQDEIRQTDVRFMSSSDKRSFFAALRKKNLVATRSRRVKDIKIDEVRLLSHFEVIAPRHHDWVWNGKQWVD